MNKIEEIDVNELKDIFSQLDLDHDFKITFQKIGIVKVNKGQYRGVEITIIPFGYPNPNFGQDLSDVVSRSIISTGLKFGFIKVMNENYETSLSRGGISVNIGDIENFFHNPDGSHKHKGLSSIEVRLVQTYD
jgi:hypothetical protein